MTRWNHFIQAVHQQFAFLESEYGLSRRSEAPPCVIYESESVRAKVYFGRRYELDLVVKRVCDGPGVPSVGIALMMQYAGVPLNDIPLSPFPSTPQEIRSEVEKVAKLARTYGDDLLRGDETRWRVIRAHH